MKVLRVVRLVVVCLAFLPATAGAQIGSGITGLVRDTSGGLLPGVTVETESPALIGGARVAVTDADGRYRFTDLRPGTYTLSFTLPGFSVLRREGIELQAEFTATVNGELAVGTVLETVTVTGDAPVVDTVNVRQQTQVSEETLQAIPTNRRMAGLAAILPGASTLRPSDHDVGGVQAERGTFTIHGTPNVDQATEGMYQVLQNRASYSYNTHAIREVVIETGTGSAESFSGGSVLHYIYKDGGNVFSGVFSATNATKALQANNLTADLLARASSQLKQAGGLKEAFDVGGGIGGPILRNKLWFYYATRLVGTGQYQTGNFYNATQGTMFYTPDESRPAYTRERIRDFGSLRATWQAAEKHRIAAFVSVQKNCLCTYMLLEPAVLPAPEAVGDHKYSPLYTPLATWTYPASNKLLFEAAGSAQVLTNHTKRPALTGTNDISILDVGLNRLYNSRAANLTQTGSYTTNPTKNFHEKFTVSYVRGTHNFKTGILTTQFTDAAGPGHFTDGNQINQARSYTFRNSVPEAVTIWAVPHGPRGRATNTGVFVQDQWTLQRLTLNLGLRYQAWKGSTPEQVLPAGPFVPERRLAATTDNPNFKNLNPRVGAAYDLFGDARTAIKVSIGRYNILTGGEVANPANNMSLSTTRSWNDANGNYVPDCDLLNPAAHRECGQWSDLGFGKEREVTTHYADDAREGFNKQDHNWQTSVSLQRELFSGVGLNVGYFRTWYGGFLATDNLAVTPADYDEYCIAAPVDSGLPTSGQQLCGLYDVRPDKFGLVDNLVTQASNFGDQRQVYNGVDVTLSGRLLQRVQLQGGLSVGRTVLDTCDLVIDSPEVARDGFCKVVPPWSAGTQLKFLAVYPLPWNLRTSVVYQNISGVPYGASHVVSAAQVTPSLGRNLAGGARSVTKEVVPAQTLFEPRLQQVDLRLSRVFPVSGGRLTANVDLYNVLNENAVLQQNSRYGPTWRQVSLVMGGRMLRFTGQFEF